MGYEGVPEGLKAVPRWVVWRLVHKGDGKATKVPCNASTGLPADAHDPANQLSFEAAVAASGAFSGIGFVFVGGDGFCGVDLDHCLDENGEIALWAERILDGLQSYAERSPSGRGIKVFLRGSLPAGATSHKKNGLGEDKSGAVEFYADRRFFTVTGEHWEGTRATVEDRGEELAAFYRECFPPTAKDPGVPPPAPNGVPMSDDEILTAARFAKNSVRFRALFDRGELGRYHGDASRADLALCSDLAFWCRGDRATIDRLFRRSKLYREKWDREDYRRLTIDKALSGMGGYYSGRPTDGPGDPIPPGTSLIIWASAVVPVNVEWLWPGHIPAGKLTTFAGRTGLGKTFALCDIAARVTTGAQWPFCGGECAQIGKVLIISAEDDVDDTLVPRLIEMGADLSKVAFLAPEAEERFTLSALELLTKVKDQMGPDLRFVAIDPPTSYLAGVDDHSNAELRSVLTPLKRWCKATGVAVELITHVNKGGVGVEALARVMGSVAWVNAVRTAWMFAPDQDDSSKRLFLPLKVNVGKEPKGLSYRIDPCGDERAKLTWLGEVDITADEAMCGEKSVKKSKAKLAHDWLIEIFRERREWAGDLFLARAREVGLTEDDVSRAKTKLKIPRPRRTVGVGGHVSYVYWVPDNWEYLSDKKHAELRNCGTESEVFSNQDVPVPQSVPHVDRTAELDGTPVPQSIPACRTDFGTGTSTEITVCDAVPQFRNSVDVDGNVVVVAMEILMDNLRWGPRRAAAVEEYALFRWGISREVMQDAADRFEIVKSMVDGELYWSLKGGIDK